MSIWDSSFADLSGIEWLEPILPLFIAVVSGLVVVEFLLKPMRRFLEGRAYSLSAGVIGVCSGRMLMGALLALVYAMYANGIADAYNVYGPLPFLASWVGGGLAASLLGGAIGVILGVEEGLILAFPLLALLGRFRSTN